MTVLLIWLAASQVLQLSCWTTMSSPDSVLWTCLKLGSEWCRDSLETAFEITKLIKFSPKRNAPLDKIRTQIEAGAEDSAVTTHTIWSFCSTRWTVHSEAVGGCLEGRLDPNIKGRITGVMTKITWCKTCFWAKPCKKSLTTSAEHCKSSHYQLLKGKQ